MSEEKLIIVSGDSHAEPPPEVWKDYLESEYHEYLLNAVEDNNTYTQLLALLADFKTYKPEMLEVIDTDGVWESGGIDGALGDLDRRLAEMDREGIAAEMVYWGDPRALHPFAPAFRELPQDVIAAGSRVYHRWLADKYGAATDRLLLVGDPGAGVDVDAMVSDLVWTAERDFAGAYLPKFFVRDDLPPLYDPYFDPFWAACVEHNMFVVCHAGYGSVVNEFGRRIEEAKKLMSEAGGSGDLLDQLNNKTKDFFHRSYVPLQAVWQLMLGGVFDRFPDLRLVLTEVRADWIPALLAHLDAAFDRAGDSVRATRKPSEYWMSNCLQSISFVHKCEVPMRHEIGVDNIIFGRDYPHPEGTWPNTREWLRDSFVGVSEGDMRKVLGENAIRMLGLDRAKLAAVADKIGPSYSDVANPGPELDPRMIESWDMRSGYLKPAEGVEAESIDALLRVDAGLASLVS